jgi:hypothetical protein
MSLRMKRRRISHEEESSSETESIGDEEFISLDVSDEETVNNDSIFTLIKRTTAKTEGCTFCRYTPCNRKAIGWFIRYYMEGPVQFLHIHTICARCYRKTNELPRTGFRFEVKVVPYAKEELSDAAKYVRICYPFAWEHFKFVPEILDILAQRLRHKRQLLTEIEEFLFHRYRVVILGPDCQKYLAHELILSDCLHLAFESMHISWSLITFTQELDLNMRRNLFYFPFRVIM